MTSQAPAAGRPSPADPSAAMDGLWATMIYHGTSRFGLGLDYLVGLGLLAVLVLVAARLYPGLAR